MVVGMDRIEMAEDGDACRDGVMVDDKEGIGLHVIVTFNISFQRHLIPTMIPT